MKRLLAVAALLLLLGGTARGAEVVVLSAAAVRPPLQAAAEMLRADPDGAPRLSFGTAGATRDRIAAGAAADVVVLPPAGLDALVRQGLVVAGSTRPLGETRLGVAVHAGAPRPAIASEADIRQALLAAPAIGLADPATGATTGLYLAGLLRRMGLEETLRPRLHLYPDGSAAMAALARGEVALAIGQISEIKPVPGVDLVGPLAEALQLRTPYVAGIASHAQAPAAAARLIALLRAPRMAPAFAAAGFDPPPRFDATEGDVVLPQFRFQSGEVLPDLKLHYTTLGHPSFDAAGQITNAVLALHGTTGTGRNFLAPSLADVLFGPGEILDAEKYYIVLPDGIGRGGSSKPSDGLRSRFPHYGYIDLVEGQHALVTALHIAHLRLVLGTSMGGMHAWLWAERYPDMMDAVFPVASQPVAVTGRNFMWRDLIMRAIREDPDWHGGDYTSQPTHYQSVLPLFTIMTGSPRTLEAAGPTQTRAAAAMDAMVDAARHAVDANDYLYWFAAVADYDPEPALERIRARVFAVNFADDLLNPVQLGVMARVMPRVSGGRYAIVPEGPETIGHQTLTQAKVWVGYLAELMEEK